MSGDAKVWDTASGELIGTLTGHIGPVLAMLVTQDGRRILTGGGDNTVRVWDAARCELLLTIRIQGNVTALAASGDGASIAAGTHLGGVYLWNTRQPASSLAPGTSLANIMK